MPNRSYNNGNTDSRFNFTGKELEDDFGLNWYHYGARYYDPALARWTSVDPLASKYLNVSPYNYCGNEPINKYDPNGRELYVFGDINSSLEDLQGFVGKDADRLSVGNDGKVLINVDGYDGENENLDLLIEIDGAVDIDGNNVKIGYSADDTPIPESEIDATGELKTSGITNASTTHRYKGMSQESNPVYHGDKPKNGFDGEVTISKKVGWIGKDGKPVKRSQVQGHELKENLIRSRDKKNYFDAHDEANKTFNGNLKKAVKKEEKRKYHF